MDTAEASETQARLPAAVHALNHDARPSACLAANQWLLRCSGPRRRGQSPPPPGRPGLAPGRRPPPLRRADAPPEDPVTGPRAPRARPGAAAPRRALLAARRFCATTALRQLLTQICLTLAALRAEGGVDGLFERMPHRPSRRPGSTHRAARGGCAGPGRRLKGRRRRAVPVSHANFSRTRQLCSSSSTGNPRRHPRMTIGFPSTSATTEFSGAYTELGPRGVLPPSPGVGSPAKLPPHDRQASTVVLRAAHAVDRRCAPSPRGAPAPATFPPPCFDCPRRRHCRIACDPIGRSNPVTGLGFWHLRKARSPGGVRHHNLVEGLGFWHMRKARSPGRSQAPQFNPRLCTWKQQSQVHYAAMYSSSDVKQAPKSKGVLCKGTRCIFV